MIKFFRNIRRSTLNENRMGKYLKYAIGEIILVMIGILLALQVNNWNENRKLVQKEKIYLQGLKEDFLISNIALDRVINKTNRINSTTSYLIDVIRKKSPEITFTKLDSLIDSSAGYTIFMDSEGVINDIIGSGQLGLISNAYLRKEIASWEANLKMIRGVEELGKSSAKTYSNSIKKYMDYSNYKYDTLAFIESKKEEIFNDIQYRNLLYDIYDLSNWLNDLYKVKKQHIDTLIQVIDKELKPTND